jgi:ribosomal protein S18 acetylase RimI-like enzyme
MKITRYDGADVLQVQGELELIYEEAFVEPPYSKTPADTASNFRRFQRQVTRPGFRAILARDGKGRPTGMAYGHLLAANTGWWDTLTAPVADELRREDGKRTFGLFELAVRPAFRREHVATGLHEALIDGLTCERVLLNTRPEATAAMSAYRAWGYRKVGENYPWDGASLHEVLLLDLPR